MLSGTRRNLWSAANSEIIQSLNCIVGKAKFMETSVLEGELKEMEAYLLLLYDSTFFIVHTGRKSEIC